MGEVQEPQLRRWLSENGLNLPEDFVAFLELTGGGDLFESETILGPYGDVELEIHPQRRQHQAPIWKACQQAMLSFITGWIFLRSGL